MDFYKKIVKSKDTASVLSEKEYKCASLQAITNETIKGNDKKVLKELGEEINGHLADLRAIKDDGDAKNKEKCASLIERFEECLVKIVNTKPDVISNISSQLQILQNLTNVAIRDNNLVDLKKLSETMERNLSIVKEVPEVKRAKNSVNGNERVLEVVNKYTSLLNKVLTHINAQSRVISGPVLIQTTQKSVSEKEIPPPLLKKTSQTEVEEKLKLMRQKRLNRSSMFVDEQTKLAEQRSRDNSPKNDKKAFQNSNPDRAEYKNLVVSPEILKPSLFKANLVKNNQSHYRNVVIKEKGGVATGASKKIATASSATDVPVENQKFAETENDEVFQRQPAGDDSGDVTSDTTRSFAERQIEKARNQGERSRVSLKSTNSTKTTPPRTPTQIRKIFNSFNNCVLGTNKNKSVEDLPSEFNSPFEQELKNIKLRRTGSNRQESFKARENLDEDAKGPILAKNPVPASPTLLPRKSKFVLEGPSPPLQPKPKPLDMALRTRRGNGECVEETSLPKELPPPLPPKQKRLAVQKPIMVLSRAATENTKPEYEEGKIEAEKPRVGVIKKGQPSVQSTSEDSVEVRHHESDLVKQEPIACTITIKRDSKTVEPPVEKSSFSTFRSSTDSVRDERCVENPLYGIVTADEGKPRKVSRHNSINIDAMLMSAKAKEQRNTDLIFSDFEDRIYKPYYRRELANGGNKFIALEPDIAKLEYVIKVFMGLKRDEEYSIIDKLLSKYYVRVDEVPAVNAFDKIEKNSLLERLTQASRDLEKRTINNENLLRTVLDEQAVAIAEKYGIVRGN